MPELEYELTTSDGSLLHTRDLEDADRLEARQRLQEARLDRDLHLSERRRAFVSNKLANTALDDIDIEYELAA